ncbi:YraN family protein [Acuticoccus mangrovi]|uniref:UPF0102 protein JCR33_24365 n=1 Tax=Acuticoccus mangrovi TaxID=2796142 RepID=A0A934MJG1_9HYPH|nr:YraN family protein [Acuticoccus mangrovi]
MVTVPLGVGRAAPFFPVPAGRSRRTSAERRRSYDFGLAAERDAAHFLRAGGYAILRQRFKGRSGEIDLVAQRDDTVAFVEVKARRRGWDGLDALDWRKQARISAAADEWLAAHPVYAGYCQRYDIALVWPGGAIEYLENAFEHVESGGW